MSQPALPFKRITTEEWQVHLAVLAAQPRPPPAPPKRPVGRPKRKLNANDVLAAAAAVDQPLKKTRGTYTEWFSSPYIHDILQEYAKDHRPTLTVQRLKDKAPDDRYERLSHTTLISWFDKEHQLKPRFKAWLECGLENVRQNGTVSAFEQEPAVEEEIKHTLIQMRSAGTVINAHIVRWVMQGIIEMRTPQESKLRTLKLGSSFISAWARHALKWSWRKSTTTASKLPLDWEDQGLQMAMRIGAVMEMQNVHPSLIINMDQTGIHLVPTSNWTYEETGSSSVAVIGANDKRQITACIASSLAGDVLPLQLIFQGKTPRSLPPCTIESKAAQVHLTFSENHWSNQETMQQYIEEVIMPYAERCIQRHQLSSTANIILVLDVWAVHKSEEFRRFLRTKYPRIQLVFVPPNCTSKLQVADVALQRPFKHGITKRFNEWASKQVVQQIASEKVVGLADLLKMGTLKPLVLQWCIESWKELKDHPELIVAGWYQCCLSLFDVTDPQKRTKALVAVVEKKLEMTHIPDQNEQDAESDHEEDSDDELDLTTPRQFGKQSDRIRSATKPFGYQIATDQIAMTDSE